MTRYRTGGDWGRTIIREGTATPDAEGRRADDELIGGMTTSAHANLVVDSLNGHAPTRDGAVADWLKRHRDNYTGEGWATAWNAIDELLDDYRDHADTGTPLHQDVEGPHGEGL